MDVAVSVSTIMTEVQRERKEGRQEIKGRMRATRQVHRKIKQVCTHYLGKVAGWAQA